LLVARPVIKETEISEGRSPIGVEAAGLRSAEDKAPACGEGRKAADSRRSGLDEHRPSVDRQRGDGVGSRESVEGAAGIDRHCAGI